jgi:hypothetical protein
MVYVKGQAFKAADANRLIERLNDEPVSAEIDNKGRVILQPLQGMAAYETMKGKALLGIDSGSQQPKIELSNLQEQTVIDGANTIYATCGSTAIEAGQTGYGNILVEGQWHWLKAESGVVGYCGLAPGSGVIKQDYLGFLSLGTTTADGVTLAYCTTYSGQMFRFKTKATGIAAGTFAKAFIMKPTTTAWIVTTLELDIWSPEDAVGNNKEVIVGYVNGRLEVIVESCA